MTKTEKEIIEMLQIQLGETTKELQTARTFIKWHKDLTDQWALMKEMVEYDHSALYAVLYEWLHDERDLKEVELCAIYREKMNEVKKGLK
jgi:hypothetical protein